MKVRVHATIANFGPGFDVFGVGVGKPYDELSFKESDEWMVRVKGYQVPENSNNIAIVSAKALAAMVGEETALEMKLTKGIRPKSGIGSSGASSLAGALAMAKVLGVEDDEMILRAAMEGERVASGSVHGDNVIPAYYGDFTIIESYEPLKIWRIPVNFEVVVVLPAIEIPTSEARKILPSKIPRKDAIRNLALAASLILALKENDLQTVGRLLDDRIALPYRKQLMQWYETVREAALEAGAYGFSVSGSGPAVFAIGEDVAQIGKVIAETFSGMDIKADVYVTKVGRGAIWF
ncbi:homoserine kinase [Thermococcus sibiricus]|uniref:Homoserine kinase n=1 Tax=Thermococcus sibiricus (strain DSM 12597 / MM 739) TaxID=604354 RepID=C6A3H7_THESM|nr:homoserine kinase [Thermococcus sibiricus]ACS90172.1 Homoserine kinase [Thermococcus sibiricus MM 739]